jgi:hypothetical protein
MTSALAVGVSARDAYVFECDHLHWDSKEKYAFGHLWEVEFLTKSFSPGGDMLMLFEEVITIDSILVVLYGSPINYWVLTIDDPREFTYGNDKLIHMYRISDNTAELTSTDPTVARPVIITALRKDIFKSAKVTAEYDDIEIKNVFFCEPDPYGRYFFLYETNYGNYVFYKNYYDEAELAEGKIAHEYLFPMEMIYPYAKRGDYKLDELMEAGGVDLSQYRLGVYSEEFPLPNGRNYDIYDPKLSDPSIIFSVTALISLGGFAAFAVKRPRRKET